MKRTILIRSFQPSLLAVATILFLGSCGGETTPPDAGVRPATGEANVPAAPATAPGDVPKSELPVDQAATEPVESKGGKESKVEDGAPSQAALDLAVKTPMKEGKAAESGVEVATLGGGCFWCTEAVMERLEGVSDVVSGYMGGHVENPTYEQICTKTTGHAEVIEVTYDPKVISFEEILDVFWQAHDPTTLNQQGADKGPQYRSVVFYHSPMQRNTAIQSMKKLNESGMYPDPAVTEISEATKFWVAEEYHQNYYVQNKDTNPYCRAVISPKLKKMGME